MKLLFVNTDTGITQNVIRDDCVVLFYGCDEELTWDLAKLRENTNNAISLKTQDENLEFESIAFVFHGGNMLQQIYSMKFFSPESLWKKILEPDEELLTDEKIPYALEGSDLFIFIKELVEKYKVPQINFLGCRLLQFDSWNKYFSLLKELLQVEIGASDDLTGNINYGGDWELESTNEDIKNAYFNDNIDNYSELLINNPADFVGDPDDVQFFVDHSVNTNPRRTNYTLKGDLTIKNPQQYIHCFIADGASFDGNCHTITLEYSTIAPNTLFDGIFKVLNGKVNNLNVIVDLPLSYNGFLALGVGAGIIVSGYSGMYPGNKCIVENCSFMCTDGSVAQITIFGTGNGFIVGQACGGYGGYAEIKSCTSYANLAGLYNGMIVGIFAGIEGTCIIENCHSYGEIRPSGTLVPPSSLLLSLYNGGIVGALAGSEGFCFVRNCKSFGNIYGGYSGGIAGGYAGGSDGFDSSRTFSSGYCVIVCCESEGNIGYSVFGASPNNPNRGGCGGISGAYSGGGNGTIIIADCESKGIIEACSGGITGRDTGNDQGTAVILRCVSRGLIFGTYASGIAGPKRTVSNTNTFVSANTNIAGFSHTGLVALIDCVSYGQIQGNFSTGILGSNGISSSDGGVFLVLNCISFGNITGGFSSGITLSENSNSSVVITSVLIRLPLVIVMNCVSVGDINPISNTFASGIVTRYISVLSASSPNNGSNNANLYVVNCISLGKIIGNNSAGTVTIRTANITTTVPFNLTMYILNCMSFGEIIGTNAGGIIAMDNLLRFNMYILVKNCFTAGKITGQNAGGIAGAKFGANEVPSTPSADPVLNDFNIDSCTTCGDINGSNAGGICGADASVVRLFNCMAFGKVNGSSAGGLLGTNPTYILAGDNFCRTRIVLPIYNSQINDLTLKIDGTTDYITAGQVPKNYITDTVRCKSLKYYLGHQGVAISLSDPTILMDITTNHKLTGDNSHPMRLNDNEVPNNSEHASFLSECFRSTVFMEFFVSKPLADTEPFKIVLYIPNASPLVKGRYGLYSESGKLICYLKNLSPETKLLDMFTYKYQNSFADKITSKKSLIPAYDGYLRHDLVNMYACNLYKLKYGTYQVKLDTHYKPHCKKHCRTKTKYNKLCYGVDCNNSKCDQSKIVKRNFINVPQQCECKPSIQPQCPLQCGCKMSSDQCNDKCDCDTIQSII